MTLEPIMSKCVDLHPCSIPLVLKKHSPLLYTEKAGTLELRSNSDAKSTPPAVFAIAETIKPTKKKKNPTTESMLQPHLIPLSYLLWFSRCYFLQVLSPCSSSSHPTSRCSSALCFSLCLLLGGTLELMPVLPLHSQIFISERWVFITALISISISALPWSYVCFHLGEKYTLTQLIYYIFLRTHKHSHKHCYLNHLPHYRAP